MRASAGVGRTVLELIGNRSFQLDLLLTLAAIAVALWRPRVGAAAFARIERGIGRIAARPLFSLVSIAALLILLRLALLPLLPFPGVVGRDESSLLLQAQTFAAGHLANPVHPMGAFFESVYVHQWPSYGSMYFPGRGLELALGLKLFGSVGAGVLLVLAAAAAALVWMLRGWVSPSPAYVGGLVFVARFGLFSNLMNQPVGLAVPILGGALVIGAYPRLMRSVSLRDSVLLALGVFLSFTSRPFESLLLFAPFAVALAWRTILLLRERASGAGLRLAIPAIGGIGAAAALLLAYDAANTGSMTHAPYSMNRENYAGTPAFLFQPARPPLLHPAEPLQGYYKLEGQGYRDYQSFPHFVAKSAAKIRNLWSFFFGVALTIPLLFGIGWLRRQPVPLIGLLLLIGGFLSVQFSWPHYLLPAMGLLLLVVVEGLGRMRGSACGLFLSRALPLVALAGWAVPLSTLATGHPPAAASVVQACCYLDTPYARRAVEQQLLAMPGKHLVFVRYRPEDSRWDQWVFNNADIDGSRIVWAHDLGPARDAELVAYYPDRKVWLIDGVSAPRLRPWR